MADYALRTLQQVDATGPSGPAQTIAGNDDRSGVHSGELHELGADPTVVLVPLIEGSSPIGVLELEFEEWDGVVPELLDPIVAIFVMAWIVKSRYTDTRPGPGDPSR